MLFTLSTRRFFGGLKFISFQHELKERIGILLENEGVVVDFAKVCPKATSSAPDFLSRWCSMRERVYNALDDKRFHINAKEVKLLSPISGNVRVIGVGANYLSPEETRKPFFFEKSSHSIQNPGSPVYIRKQSHNVVLEGELAFVIGKQGKYIRKEDSIEHIAGVTVANDITDFAFREEGRGSIVFGKSQETFLPLGPYLILNDSKFTDTTSFVVRSKINGEVVQEMDTSNLVMKIPELIEFISSFITLNPGDIILTGTPPSLTSKSGRTTRIQHGDEMEISINGVGVLKNTVLINES